MPILTLTLGPVTLSTHPLETPRFLIGSHPECDLRLDSLAVASRHVELVEGEDGYRLRGLDPEYPVRVNDQDPGYAPLRHGDSFQVGAYRLLFGEEGLELPILEPETEPQVEPQPPAALGAGAPPPAPESTGAAYLQILNGPRIGRILPIDQPETSLIRGPRGEVRLTREDDRYLLDARQAAVPVLLDGVPVGEEPVSLADGQELQIGPLRLWFFVH